MYTAIRPGTFFPIGMNGACCSSCAHKGMGLFDSGLDFTGWGWPELLVAGLGGYMIFSTIFTTSKGVSEIRRIPGERRRRKAAILRKRAAELSKKKGFFG